MGLISRKDGIEHIDTNVLVRLIVKDEPKQVKKAQKLFSHKEKLYIFEDSAMMEVVFVLSGIYQFAREQVARDIKNIMQLENLVCNKSIISATLDLYVEHPKLSFVDCYLAILTDTSQEKPLWTFDHKLATQCPVARAL